MFSSSSPSSRRPTKPTHTFSVVYVAVMLFAFHWSLVAYVNSTYLSQFISNRTVGLLYILASSSTFIALFFMPRALRAFGNYTLAITLAIAEGCMLIVLAIAPPFIVVPLFVLHHALVPLLVLTIDIFTEQRIGKQEGITGEKRGLQLAIVSIAYAIATLGGGLLLGSGQPRFFLVYLASALCIFAFCWYIHRKFKTFSDPSYSDINIFKTLRYFWIKRDFRLIFLCNFLLQLFFAWMVIYVPLYLSTVIRFAWNEIGLILFVGLFAYVLFEYPVGVIADRWVGEKELMALGFIILAITTMYIAFLKTPLLSSWMIIMFMTRLGASLVEVTTESYFFKHTKDADASVISFFRASAPLAYMFGTLFGMLSLLWVPFNYAFVLLGLSMLPGILFALLLRDTR